MVSIYALINPIDNTVFYIGATRHIDKRLTQHIWESTQNNSYKARAIRNIVELGYSPCIKEIKKCEALEVSTNENFYISFFKECGYPVYQIPKSTYSKTFATRISSTLERGKWYAESF